jgi:hypothetical protein
MSVGYSIVNLLPVHVIIWQGDTSLPHSRCLRYSVKAGDLPPGGESLAYLLAVRGGRKPMPPRSGVLGYGTKGGEEALGLPGRFKSLPAPLPLAGGLVRVRGAVLEIAMLAMFHARQEFSFGGIVASQSVCDHHSWHVPHTLERVAEERVRGDLVAPALDQDIEPMPVLIHRPPQMMALPIDRQKDLIQILLVPSARTAPT